MNKEMNTMWGVWWKERCAEDSFEGTFWLRDASAYRCSFAHKMLQAVIEESYHFLIRGMGCGQHRQGCDVMCVVVISASYLAAARMS